MRDAEIIVTAAPAASARRRPPRCSRSKARAPAGAPSSSRSIRRSASPTRSDSRALSNTPSQIDGDWPGELWAMMLDTKSTFDDLVDEALGRSGAGRSHPRQPLLQEHLRCACRARRSTWRWRSCTSSTATADFDLVVVDTPPTRNALDFLDAPRRLTRFLDHRLYRILMAPTRGLMKAVNVAAQAFVRTLSKVVGARGDRRCHHVLHSVRRDGGRLQAAGQHGVRAARVAERRPSCSSPPRDATRSRRPTSSPAACSRRTSTCGR